MKGPYPKHKSYYLINLSFYRYIASSKVSSSMCSSASSFNFWYILFSFRWSSICLHLLPRLLILICLSILCFRRQFLCIIELIQLVFLHFIFCRIFLSSLTLCNTSFFTWSVQLIFCILLHHYIPKVSRQFRSISWSVQVSSSYEAMLQM